MRFVLLIAVAVVVVCNAGHCSAAIILSTDFDSVDERTSFLPNAWDGPNGEPFGLAGDTSNTALGNATSNRNNLRTTLGSGVGGTQGLTGANGDAMIRSRSTFDSTINTSFSGYFRYATPTTSNPNYVGFSLGWTLPAGADNVGVTGNRNDKVQLGVGFSTSLTGGNATIEGNGRLNELGNDIPGNVLTLQDQNWYRLSFELVNNNDSTWTASNISLDDFGTTGTMLIGNVEMIASATFNPGNGGNLDASTSAYATAALDASRGASAMDNLLIQQVVAIPEPSSLAFFAFSAGLLAYKRRNRTKLTV